MVDGTGAPARAADVALDGDRIAAIGPASDVGRGHREIDADGRLVLPGWVDVHTHYDGQATWDPELTPSARMLNEMRDRGEGFYHFARRMSEIHQHFFRNLPLDNDKEKYFDELAIKSIEDQAAMEATNEISFERYLQRYYSQS